MPELPEVQTVADHIKPDLIGKNVTGIEPVWKKVLHNFAKNDLTGKHKIKNVSRRAKFIIIEFNNFLLAVHLRMTGKLYILDQDTLPKHTSAIIHLENSNILFLKTQENLAEYICTKIFQRSTADMVLSHLKKILRASGSC